MTSEKDPLIPKHDEDGAGLSPHGSRLYYVIASVAALVVVLGLSGLYVSAPGVKPLSVPYYNGGVTNDRCMVYTFYDDIGFDNVEQAGEIDVWAQSYRKAGWKVGVLTSKDAKRHPLYNELIGKFNAFPTVNKKEYEVACFVRWLAVAAVGGGWMSDYDTFNVNLPPPPECNSLPYDGKLTTHQGGVPALVSGTAEEYARFAQLMASTDANEYMAAQPAGAPQIISDMSLAMYYSPKGLINTVATFQKSPKTLQQPPCDADGSSIYPLIFHVPHHSMGELQQSPEEPRKDVMQRWFSTVSQSVAQCTPVQYDHTDAAYTAKFFPNAALGAISPKHMRAQMEEFLKHRHTR